MNFKSWIEKQHRANKAPGSAEVIRTGLQPQVGATAMTHEEMKDKIMAIDSHFQNIKNAIDSIDPIDDTSSQIKTFGEKMMKKWHRMKNSYARNRHH